jgi:RimJ/RimL family protein N-acetyltransferase
LTVAALASRIELADKRGGVFAVRPYTPADRRALEEMYVDFRPKRMAQGLPPDSELELKRWLDRVLASGDHLLIEIAGEVMGHGMLIPMEGAAAELANFLHQAVRDRGIGTALNRVLLETAHRKGLQRVWLSVEPWNRAAVRSYEKAGFRQLPGSLWAPEVEMEARIAGRAERGDRSSEGSEGVGPP